MTCFWVSLGLFSLEMYALYHVYSSSMYRTKLLDPEFLITECHRLGWCLQLKSKECTSKSGSMDTCFILSIHLKLKSPSILFPKLKFHNRSKWIFLLSCIDYSSLVFWTPWVYINHYSHTVQFFTRIWKVWLYALWQAQVLLMTMIKVPCWKLFVKLPHIQEKLYYPRFKI